MNSEMKGRYYTLCVFCAKWDNKTQNLKNE